MNRTLDIDYGDGRLLDIYHPGGTLRPLVVWVHGSAFLRDNGRLGADVIAERLGPRGYAVAGVAIRSSSQARYPAQLHDITDALQYVISNAAAYGIDPDAIVTMGESSGGWAAAMGALHEPRVRGAVPMYPPTDFLAMDSQMRPGSIERFAEFTGGGGHDDPNSPESLLIGAPIQERPDLADEASPRLHVHPEAPPFLILHGELDDLVPFAQGKSLAQTLAANGTDVEFIQFPHAGHGSWAQWLDDDELSRGAVLSRAQNGALVRIGDVDADWDLVQRFIARVIPD